MPLPGGQSTQSGVLYQNTVATEFLVGLILDEDSLHSVQVEAPQPVGDVVLCRREGADVHVQIKQDPSTGQWTAARLQAEGFWQSAWDQLRNDPHAEIWLITPGPCPVLRELAERARTFGAPDGLLAHVSAAQRKEFERISQSLQVDVGSVVNLITHIYVKDAFGSASIIEQRARNALEGPVGQDAFVVLRDLVAAGSPIGRIFTRLDVIKGLNNHGLMTLRSAPRTLVIADLKQLTKRCAESISATISSAVRDKYLPNLFVTRSVQQGILRTMRKNSANLSVLFDEFASMIATCRDSLSKRHRAVHDLLTDDQVHDLGDRYNNLLDVLRDVRARLGNLQSMDWAQQRTKLELLISALHDPDGDDIVRTLRKILNNIAVVVDKAGRGKTNLLCHLAVELCRDNPVVFLIGGELRLEQPSDLFQMIAGYMGIDPEDDTLEWFESLNQILRVHENSLILVIDAVNECPDWEMLRAGLEKLAIRTYDCNLRILFSCRDVLWQGYFHRPNDVISSYTSSEFSLGDFTANEFDEVFPRYCKHFHMEITTISHEAHLALHHPLLLRFFCEAYGSPFGATVKLAPLTNIRLKKLFDDYWEKKCGHIKDKLRHRTTAQIDKFLCSLALSMLKRNDRYIPIDDMPRITGESDLQSAASDYTAILDEDVILEQSPAGQRPVTYFTYDEFMEYVIARAKLPDLSRNPLSVITELGDILKKRKRFPNALGVVGYLSIMLKEQRNVSVWGPLMAQYPAWRVTGVRSCSQLDASQWDREILSMITTTIAEFCERPAGRDLYEELQRFSDRLSEYDPVGSVPIWQTWLLGGLTEARLKAARSLGHLASRGYAGALQVLFDAADCTNDDVCGTAVNALAVVPNEKVLAALIRLSHHASPLVREMIAYSIGCFSPCTDSLLALVDMTHDPDLDVCLTAATSLVRDPSEKVGTTLGALSRRLQRRPGIDAKSYSVVVSKMGVVWGHLHSDKRVDAASVVFDGPYDQDVSSRVQTLRGQIALHSDPVNADALSFLGGLLRFEQEKAG